MTDSISNRDPGAWLRLCALEQQRDFHFLSKLLQLTPHTWARLDLTERRLYLQWAERFEKRFTEVANFCRRNTPQNADIPVPDFLKVTP